MNRKPGPNMDSIRFSLAFAGVLLALVGTLKGYSTASTAAVLFAVLVAMNFKSLNRVAKGIALLTATAAFSALLIDDVRIDVRAGVFLFAFLTVSGSLRIAAANEPAIQALGQQLTRTPRNRQFVLISLTTGLLALVLLNGALNFVSGIFSEKTNAPLGDRLRLTRTFISGFALNPILSPMAIPFVVVSSMLPAIRWQAMLPFLAVCAGLIWFSGRLQNLVTGFIGADGVREHRASNPQDFSLPVEQKLTALALILTPILMTLVLAVFAGLKPSHAALTSVFVVSLIWPGLRLKNPSLIRSGYKVSINEATIIGSSLILGSLILEYFPPDWEQAAGNLLFAAGPFSAPLVIAFFCVGGLVGLQPCICFLLGYAAIHPFASALGAGVAPFYAAVIVGWALNSLVSPVGLPVMVVSQAFNISAADFALKHGWVFFGLSIILTSLTLTIAMF